MQLHGRLSSNLEKQNHHLCPMPRSNDSNKKWTIDVIFRHTNTGLLGSLAVRGNKLPSASGEASS